MDIWKAAKEGSVVSLKKLIEQDPCLIDKRDNSGQCALHLSVQGGHLECFDILIENGAKVNVVDSDDRTPLHYAAENGGQKSKHFMSELIGTAAEIDAIDYEEMTPLHLACYAGNAVAVSLLLKNNASVGSKDLEGKDALMRAVSGTNTETLTILQRLVEEFGARVSITDNSGMTPLMCAAEANNETAVKYLIKLGADVNAVNKKGECATYLTVSSGKDNTQATLKFLCKSGADLNRKVKLSYGFETPLVSAVQDRDFETMKLLLQHGSGLARELNGLIGGDTVRFPNDVYCDMILIVAGVFVDRPWNHYITEYKDIGDESQSRVQLCEKLEKEHDNDDSAKATNHNGDTTSDRDDGFDCVTRYDDDYDGSHILLRKLCRFSIRCHLLAVNPDRNLVYLVEQLEVYLPTLMREFLLYEFPMDDVKQKYPLFKMYLREFGMVEDSSSSDSSSDDEISKSA